MYWKNPVRSWRKQQDRYQYLNQEGRLVSWTRIHTPPVSFVQQTNYIVGIIKLKSGKQVTAQLVEIDQSQLKKGLKVKGILRKLYEDGEAGVITYGVKFKPL